MRQSSLTNPHAIILLVGGAVAAAAVLALAGAPTSAILLVAAGAVVLPIVMGSLASAASGGRDTRTDVHRALEPDDEYDFEYGEVPSEAVPAAATGPDAIDDFLAFFEGEASEEPGLVRAAGAPGGVGIPDQPPAADHITPWEPPPPPPPEPDPMFEPGVATTGAPLAHPRPAPPPAPATDPVHAAAETDVYKRALDQCRLAFRRHPVPTVAFDHHGTLTMMNDAARDLLAATTTPGSEVTWRDLLRLTDLAGNELPADRHPVSLALAGRSMAPLTCNLAGRGLEVTVEAVPLVSRHDEPLGALATVVAAAAHTAVSSLDRLIWDRSDAALVMDEDGKIVAWNPAAERILHYHRNDVVGRGVDLLSPLAPPGGGRGRLEDLDTRSGATHGRVVIHGGDDGEHEFVVVATPPEPTELLASGEDVTRYEGHVVCVLYPLDAAAG